jgi:methionyl-tRNA formyltransferase
MRILLLANNWVGWQVANWLKERGDEIIGLVLHPPHKRKYGKEIIQSVGLSEAYIFDGSQLHKPAVIDSINRLKADIGISIFFGYILQSNLIRIFTEGVINLHPSYLPYNRGAYPNVWSIIEGTPAGVTLHYIDAGVDTGDIIAQELVPTEMIDTAEILYRKLERTCIEVFKKNWPLILNRQAARISQSIEAGTFHQARDIELLDEIDLERVCTARELINLLRSRTFPPYAGAFFRHGGRKIYLRLQLLYEEDLQEEE